VLCKRLHHAVEVFSEDVNAKFDFTDILTQVREMAADYNELITFFKCVYQFFKQSTSVQAAFEISTKMVAERFVDAFFNSILPLKTHYVTIPPLDLTSMLEERLVLLDNEIRGWIPCSATKKFDGIAEPVCCESNQANHGARHESSQIYRQKIKRNDFGINLLGSSSTTSAPCRWDGNFECSDNYPIGWFVDRTFPGIPANTTEFWHNHKRILESQKPTLSKLKCLVCLYCMSMTPDQILECGHIVCRVCCKRLLDSGLIECPFCNHTQKWRSCRGFKAGIRVLQIDAEGVQGMSAAVLLHQIEKRLGLQVHHLFDQIVGVASGSLSALAYGSLQMSGESTVALFKALSPFILQNTKKR
jgi:hypothetical protein